MSVSFGAAVGGRQAPVFIENANFHVAQTTPKKHVEPKEITFFGQNGGNYFQKITEPEETICFGAKIGAFSLRTHGVSIYSRASYKQRLHEVVVTLILETSLGAAPPGHETLILSLWLPLLSSLS